MLGAGIRRYIFIAARALADLVFPRTCASCSSPILGDGAGHICDECARTLTLIDPSAACGRCGLPLGPFAIDHEGRYCEGCASLPLVGFRRTVAAGTYEGALRRAICRMKYGRRVHLAAPLGSILAERVCAEFGDDPPDVVVPVPLHPSRVRHRTFDQARLLALAVAEAVGRPLVAGAVARTADTPALAHQTRQQRAETMHGAFVVRTPAAVAGKSVLLVDDVMTTGATASECARVLKGAGAAEVIVAVLARTP